MFDSIHVCFHMKVISFYVQERTMKGPNRVYPAPSGHPPWGKDKPSLRSLISPCTGVTTDRGGVCASTLPTASQPQDKQVLY